VLVFFLTGLVSATWAARIPATQDRLHLSPGSLGLVVLSIEGGALLGLPAGGAMVARRGSRWSLRLAFALYPTLLIPVAVAPTLGWLAGVLVVWAAANSIIDVAMNAAGSELEQRLQRPALSRLHAAQSIGLLAGGVIAGAAAAAHIRLSIHFAVVALVSATAALVSIGWVPPGEIGRRTPILARPDRGLVLLGVVAFCAFLIDGGASNWAAVDLRTEHGASPALAAAAYTTFTVALVIVRLAGDHLVARFSRTRVVQGCGLIATLGVVLVVSAPDALVALAGWTVVGAGLALLAPTLLGAAPTRSAAAPATAIAAVTTLGYLGSFSGPPLVGALAELTALSTALTLLVIAGLTVTALASRALVDE
jgi:MFS family permease